MTMTAWPAAEPYLATVRRRAGWSCLPLFVWGWLAIASGPLAGQQPGPAACVDPLVYADVRACEKNWTPGGSKLLVELLGFKSAGMTFTSIAGDCWGEINTQQAVVVRKPCLPPPYAFEVSMTGFEPASSAAQSGLVLWRDQDNYVRLTAGFLPAGFEFVHEFGGQTHHNSYGPSRVFPTGHPFRARLRMEVGRYTVRGSIAVNGGPWLAVDGAALPKGQETTTFFNGIGLIGAGGEMKAAPLFSDWRETPLHGYRDDDFSEPRLLPVWRKMLGTSGWGDDESGFAVHDGKLAIQPFCGADLYFGNGNYAFVAQPGPLSDRWQIDVRISSFDGAAPGWFNKGGMVLWQGRRQMMSLAVVGDEQHDHMYFESIAHVTEAGVWHNRMAGFRPREVTDAWLRIARIEGNALQAKASYDGQQWHDLGKVANALDEPELRLFASGDIARQYPLRRWAVYFDEVRLTADENDKSTAGGAGEGQP